MKHYRKVERIMKAVANHRRIQILDLLDDHRGLAVVDIASKTRANIKTIDAHVNKLFAAGLITKHTMKNHVFHDLAPYGQAILKFLRKQE